MEHRLKISGKKENKNQITMRMQENAQTPESMNMHAPVQAKAEPVLVEVMHGVILSAVLITFSYLWGVTLWAWQFQG